VFWKRVPDLSSSNRESSITDGGQSLWFNGTFSTNRLHRVFESTLQLIKLTMLQYNTKMISIAS